MASSDHITDSQFKSILFQEKKDNYAKSELKNDIDTEEILSQPTCIDTNTDSSKKKKKKKVSYKNLIDSIKQSTKSSEEKDEEYKKKMNSVLGGGQFKKIDHI